MKKLERIIKKCEVCGKEFESILSSTQTNCSRKCGHLNKNSAAKRLATCLDKYGVSNPAKSSKIKDKGKKTKLDKYGDENYGCYGSKSFQNNLKEKYGDAHYSNINQGRQTCIEKYGVDTVFKLKNIQDKSKDTVQEKYGVSNVSKLDSIKEKKKQTSILNYNADNPNKSEIVQQRTKNTKLQKYNDTNYNNRDKAEITCLDKYGVKNVSQSCIVRNKLVLMYYNRILTDGRLNGLKPLFTENEFKGMNINEKYTFECELCGNIFHTNLNFKRIPHCYHCYKWTSKYETEIFDYIHDILPNTEIERNSRKIIYPYEIDLYIPSNNLAIEFNGLYWHGENNGNKNSQYHLNKTILCEEKGIQLIHLFEDEWVNHREIVQNRLKAILGITNKIIHARKCSIQEIDISLKNNFLNNVHIQGADKSRVKIGLFYDNELISVMTFGSQRVALGNKINDVTKFELLRYATKYTVVGGANKLFLYFIKKYNPTEVISYADRRWSTTLKDKVYDGMGFKLISNGTPNYWYVVNGIREHRYNYAKHNLQNILKIFDPDLSEWENMQLNGYDRIWDCGNFKFIYTKE